MKVNNTPIGNYKLEQTPLYEIITGKRTVVGYDYKLEFETVYNVLGDEFRVNNDTFTVDLHNGIIFTGQVTCLEIISGDFEIVTVTVHGRADIT